MPDPIRILSIDGGGIRGIIPAMILAELEQRAQRPTCRLFDLIAGTSTGGILALALTKPNDAGEPAYSAAQLIALYEREGSAIFSPAWHRWPIIGFIYDLFTVRYGTRDIDRVLQEYFGATKLSDAIVPLLVTAYDLQNMDPWLFKSTKAKRRADHDFPMHEAARATAAAPTYFPPLRLRSSSPSKPYALVDGGVYAQNPAMCAYVEAHTTYPDARDFLIVSLGTGQTRDAIPYRKAKRWGLAAWARPILDVVFDGVSDTVDYELDHLLPPTGGSKRHYRLQAQISADEAAMDDPSAENVARLKQVGRKVIEGNDAELTQLASALQGRL
ncbi:MAG TPA: patatin-like phospholipase family protein [Gemmatimonadales bacterium]|nr:patatin-like phospholipase family protein [Gemmatimonadales bacterium]